MSTLGQVNLAQVQQLVKTSKFALVERLAAAIADSILAVKGIEQVKVRLSKPAAPIPDFSGKIAIEIVRSQNNAIGNG